MRRGPSGITLIELCVAMVIVAVLLSAAVVSVGAVTGSRARGAVGELGGVIRSLYDTAALTGKTCRLAMDLGPEDKPGGLEYRAECAEGSVTRGMEAEKPDGGASSGSGSSSGTSGSPSASSGPSPSSGTASAIAALFGGGGGSGGLLGSGGLPFPSATDAPTLEDITKREKERVEHDAHYSTFTTPEIQARKLSGVKASVWTQGRTERITHGVAYIYFYPQGYTERAQVVVEQGKNAWTLKVSPLSGKTEVVSGVLQIPK